ncbi:MAG: 16S rRNA (cytosine(1402)-N(4))-methyltransferase RsmH [Planctomycetota bacterium]
MNSEVIDHVPVLKRELIEQISVPKDGIIIDATIGHGGHSLLFGTALGPEGQIFGFDVDCRNASRARTRLSNLSCKVNLICSNFANIREELGKFSMDKVDLIIADLGVCSSQWTDPELGLSFQSEMPLDMRLDRSLKTTAADVINRIDEQSMADLIYRFGQEKASRRIARFIVQARKKKAIRTTMELADIICRAKRQKARGRKSRIHPATRTFQALRIAVNDELENLQRFLTAACDLLRSGGYLAVISFHSLEDKLVKENFKDNKAQGIYELVTKKPIVPTLVEVRDNPRARSAKLRIARKK